MNENFATEVLHQLKATTGLVIKFLFVLNIIQFVIIGICIYCLCMPVEEYTTTQTADGIEDSHITQLSGGDYYGESSTSDDL